MSEEWGSHYSEQPIVPTAHCSDSPLFRQPIVPTAHCSDSPLFRQPIVPTAHCSDSPLFRQPIVPTAQFPTAQCSDSPMFRQPNVSDSPIFRQLFKCSYCNVLFIIILDLVFTYRVTVEVYLSDILVYFNRISYAFQISNPSLPITNSRNKIM